MQVLVLFALVAASQATALLSSGGSTQYRTQDNFGNYNFGYDEGHPSGGTFRKEAGDAHGNVAGSYGLRDADGRVRIVNYRADDSGFHADIKTNEPGVEPKDPANTLINKAVIAAPVAYAAAPVAHVAAPVAHVAAPVAYAAPHYAAAAAPFPYYAHPHLAPHYGYGYHY